MSQKPPLATPVAEEEGGRILVEDATGRRPFMRGILIHSLMARGVDYEEAYRAANAVRDRIRPKRIVRREEIASLVAEVLGPRAPAPGPLPFAADILVTGQGEGTRFSKGFLSQSLLAAAIDPNDAFDVAREIEGELVRRRTREISRHALRRLSYEALGRRIGPDAADRYLVWRGFQDDGRPLILLLGGTAGAGKTSLAHEAAHRLGISGVVSTDSIRQVMRLMLSPEIMPAIHTSSYEAHTVLAAPPGAEDPVIAGFRAQASVVSVGVSAMIDRAVAESSNLILDGVSIVPGLVETSRHAGQAEVIFLVVATLDAGAFRSRFAARGRAARARPPHHYLENLDAILHIQEHFLELADLHDVPIVNNESFDRSVLSIIGHVTETLRKKEGFDVARLLSA
jgi:2-phosphoglycerate kinase